MTNITQKAKIIKCSDHLYWYNSLVGQTINIERETKDAYWARESNSWFNCLNIIKKQDVELLSDTVEIINERNKDEQPIEG